MTRFPIVKITLLVLSVSLSGCSWKSIGEVAAGAAGVHSSNVLGGQPAENVEEPEIEPAEGR